MNNRKFKNLSKSKQEDLGKLFPDIQSLFECKESENYTHLSISVFDHWLSREEAINEIDNVSIKKEDAHDEKLYLFCNALIKLTKCYLIKFRGIKKDKITYKEFITKSEYNEHLKPKPYNTGGINWRFILVLPETEAVYFEDCDFTHHLYYRDDNNITEIYNLIKENGLFVLKQKLL